MKRLIDEKKNLKLPYIDLTSLDAPQNNPNLDFHVDSEDKLYTPIFIRGLGEFDNYAWTVTIYNDLPFTIAVYPSSILSSKIDPGESKVTTKFYQNSFYVAYIAEVGSTDGFPIS